MERIKILFFIPNLLHGGAERVLVNLVNHMDRNKYSITVQTMFDVGIYQDKLADGIRYIGGFPWYFPGNTKVYKLFTPNRLFQRYIKEDYDIIVSYLEGPSARVVGGCPATMNPRLVCWVHVEQDTRSRATYVFRTGKEADQCYNRFNRIVCVSDTVKKDFSKLFPGAVEPIVLYNTVEGDVIREKSEENISDIKFSKEEINLISAAKLQKVKGCDRMIPIIKRLRDEGCPVHMYIVGKGEEQSKLEKLADEYGVRDYFTMIGFRDNPYKYMKNADIYVCSSHREGFSTSVTESLIVGTPVVSTNCSGAYELLGENNEYGIVTDNSEDSLYDGIRRMTGAYKDYAIKAEERGKMFDTASTVKAAEDMFEDLLRK